VEPAVVVADAEAVAVRLLLADLRLRPILAESPAVATEALCQAVTEVPVQINQAVAAAPDISVAVEAAVIIVLPVVVAAVAAEAAIRRVRSV
jgi:hypothetical protein